MRSSSQNRRQVASVITKAYRRKEHRNTTKRKYRKKGNNHEKIAKGMKEQEERLRIERSEAASIRGNETDHTRLDSHALSRISLHIAILLARASSC